MTAEDIPPTTGKKCFKGCGCCDHHSGVGNNCKLHNIYFSYGDHYELMMTGCVDFRPKPGYDSHDPFAKDRRFVVGAGRDGRVTIEETGGDINGTQTNRRSN